MEQVIIMIEADIKCPNCDGEQRYISPKTTMRSQIICLRTKCKKCGKTFKIEGNIIREIKFSVD